MPFLPKLSFDTEGQNATAPQRFVVLEGEENYLGSDLELFKDWYK